jgi:outer membrane protein assembly factor BamB
VTTVQAVANRMLRQTACLVLLAAMAQSTFAAEPLYHWSFDAAHSQAGLFTPTVGDLPAHTSVASQFRPATGALQLDGKAQWCVVGETATSVVRPGDLPSSRFAISAWVYVDRLSDWDSIASAIQDNGDFERGWMLGIHNQTFCFGLVSEKTKRLTYLDSSEVLEPGNWYHVAASYDGTLMQLFVDGRLLARSDAQSGPILYPPQTHFTVGAFHDDNELHPFKGALASLSIYDTPTKASDWQQLYRARRPFFEKENPSAPAITAWPTYMRDNRRSGVTPESLALPLQRRWVYRSALPPQPAWPAPAKQNFWSQEFNLQARVIFDRAFHLVSDGDSVFFGSSADDQVVSLSLASGDPQWRFIAGGPVRLAPTLRQGKVYFGSDDGYVYCLDSDSGVQQWRFRAAPKARQIPGNNRIISSWPVRTGVLFDQGRLRVAAGLFPTQGAYQHSLNANTGKSLATGSINFSPQGYMQRRGTQLMVAQGRAPAGASGALARMRKPEPSGRPTPNDSVVFAGVTAGSTHFLATEKGLIAVDRTGKQLWQATLEGRCYSLAVAAGCLLASTDNGLVYCFSADSSEEPRQTAEELATPPDWESLTTAQEQDFATRLRRHLVRSQGFVPHAGYALVVGDSALAHAGALHKHLPMRVIVVADQTDDLQELRNQVRLAGISDRVTVHEPADEGFSYASNLFNVVVVGGGQATVAPAEVTRVLRPAGGIAILSPPKQGALDLSHWRSQDEQLSFTAEGSDSQARWLVITKSAASGVGQWTHMYGSAANTSSSDDQLVKGPLALQWFGGPGPRQMVDRHHRTVPPLVAGSWMFIPADDRVICVDSYNGAVHWNTPVPATRRVGALRDAGNMTATAEFLYIVSADSCIAISTASGEIVQRTKALLPGDQPRHWGYLAHHGNLLLGSTTQLNASRSGLSKDQIAETYYDHVPLVTSDSLFSLDRDTGQSRWQYLPTGGAILNPTLTIGDRHLYFVESNKQATLSEPSGRSTPADLLSGGASLVALDLETGSVRWRKKIEVSAIEHHLYLSYAKGILLAVGSRNGKDTEKPNVWYDLHAFDANSGDHRWSATQNQRQQTGGSHGEQDHHPAIVGDTIYVEPMAYSIRTGKARPGWSLQRGGHGCGSISASAHTVFFRAGSASMCDLETGTMGKVTSVSRPGCWINMIPANGMLLIPEASSGCTCDLAIQTSMAFAPAQPKNNSPPIGTKPD